METSSLKMTKTNSLQAPRQMEFERTHKDDQRAAGDTCGENLNMTLNPLLMEDILIPILQHLRFDGSFLKSIRILSRLWNRVALKQFLKCNFLRIPQKYNVEILTDDEIEKEAKLSKVNEFLETVGTIRNISINDDFTNDMKIFTTLEHQIQWEKITQIRFHIKFKTNYQSRYGEKLNNWTKFITEMIEKSPHLKFLDIPPQSDRSYSQEIGLSLMKSCIELKKNENFTISNLAAILSTDRDAKLLVEFSETGVRLLNFLAKPRYPLKRDFRLQIPIVSKAFEKIIESNKNNLISFGLNDRSVILVPDFQIPEKMPQLQTLHLVGDRLSQLKFKDGFQFHENFPNLLSINAKLTGHVWHGRNPYWTNLFQNPKSNTDQPPCCTVKKLKVWTLDYIEEDIFQVFPDIEELVLSHRVVVTSPEIFRYLERNCQKLKSLRVEVPDNKFDVQICFVSNVSGFSKQVVQTLMEALSCSRAIENVSVFPRKEAFEILKNVEKLHLICNDDAELVGFCDKYLEFLQEYVFNYMPKLKVKRGEV